MPARLESTARWVRHSNRLLYLPEHLVQTLSKLTHDANPRCSRDEPQTEEGGWEKKNHKVQISLNCHFKALEPKWPISEIYLTPKHEQQHESMNGMRQTMPHMGGYIVPPHCKNDSIKQLVLDHNSSVLVVCKQATTTESHQQ